MSERLGIETFGAGGDMRGFESVRERVYTPGPRTPPGPAWPSGLWTALPPPPPEPLAPGTNARNERGRGLGFGLYIARRLLEAQGGTLTAVSSPGEGSVFRIELPG